MEWCLCHHDLCVWKQKGMHFLTCSAISKPRCFALRRFRFLVTVFRIPFLVYSEPFVYSRHFSLWPCDSINIADKMIKGSTGNHNHPIGAVRKWHISELFLLCQHCWYLSNIADRYRTKLTIHIFLTAFEAFHNGSWHGVNSIGIRDGGLFVKFVCCGSSVEHNIDGDYLRLHSRKATCLDCSHVLRPGADVCVKQASSRGETKSSVWHLTIYLYNFRNSLYYIFHMYGIISQMLCFLVRTGTIVSWCKTHQNREKALHRPVPLLVCCYLLQRPVPWQQRKSDTWYNSRGGDNRWCFHLAKAPVWGVPGSQRPLEFCKGLPPS